jgi:hypothetical protein
MISRGPLVHSGHAVLPRSRAEVEDFVAICELARGSNAHALPEYQVVRFLASDRLQLRDVA